jgi:hypothetical protein
VRSSHAKLPPQRCPQVVNARSNCGEVHQDPQDDHEAAVFQQVNSQILVSVTYLTKTHDEPSDVRRGTLALANVTRKPALGQDAIHRFPTVGSLTMERLRHFSRCLGVGGRPRIGAGEGGCRSLTLAGANAYR